MDMDFRKPAKMGQSSAYGLLRGNDPQTGDAADGRGDSDTNVSVHTRTGQPKTRAQAASLFAQGPF